MRKATTLFTLLVRLIPRGGGGQVARRRHTEVRVRKLDWFARLGALVFAQLADCPSLRSLLHTLDELPFVRQALGVGRVAKSTLTDALEKPVGEIFRTALEDLLGRLRELCTAQRRRGGRRWRELMTLVDASQVGLCLSMFEWARRPGKQQAGIKLHVDR